MKLPRFTLRDLFWLVLVAGMGCAWWVERQQHAMQSSHVLKHWIETQGYGTVRYPSLGRVVVTDKRTGKSLTYNISP
jgi:hypothetical protein